ncbi:MAG TPA: riboflavin synthase [Candidatus Limnocylindrales bacterium]|nr:riboflavin synthase [Candidatus Limnocylindrales bacterium]
MFTGIVEEVGSVVTIASRGAGAVLEVSTGLPAAEIRAGDSLSVSGACLTVTEMRPGRFFADVSVETMARTTFRSMKSGARVNLERAVAAAGRLDGHLVYGHVDGTGTVREIRHAGDSRVFHINTDLSIMRYVVFKGAVAVDGVSLTISAVHTGGFEVTLIPITLDRTTFGGLRPGDRVNVETDIVGKYVLRFLELKDPGISKDFLKKHGFA